MSTILNLSAKSALDDEKEYALILDEMSIRKETYGIQKNIHL